MALIPPAMPCAQTSTSKLSFSWRPCIGPLLMILLILVAYGRLSHAATFACSSGDSACVIQAIMTANANDEDNTLNLASGTYRFTRVNPTTDGSNALPSITSDLEIIGSGAAFTQLERDPAAPPFRLFHVAASGRLQLNGITITGGDEAADRLGGGGLLSDGEVVMLNSMVRENRSAMGGGGLSISQHGGLRLMDSTVRDNQGACGGGIYNLGTVEIERSRVSGNLAALGGGLCNRGDLHLNESTIRGNMADADGGGIWVRGGTTRVTLGFLLENTAGHSGGGFFFVGGQQRFEEVFVRGNMADGNGGGGVIDQGLVALRFIFITENSAGLKGGGLWIRANRLSLWGFNITANTAGVDGGGLFVERGTVDAQNGGVGDNVPNNCNRFPCF